MSSPRYRPNQQLEIYNFRVVPGLQISKEVDFLKFICAIYFYENKVVVQNQNIVILPELCVNLAPERCRCNEIGYPRGF